MERNCALPSGFHGRIISGCKIKGLGENQVHSLGTGWAFMDQYNHPNSLSIIHLASEPVGLEKAASHPLNYLNLKKETAGWIIQIEVDICVEEFPQEEGWKPLRFDFDKGCYLGQEVMARIHAMGKVRKQAVAVAGTGTVSNELPRNLMVADKKLGHLKQHGFWTR